MNKKIISILVLLFFTIHSAIAQNRAATPVETKVIQKAVNAVVPVIDGFENKDWGKTAGGADEPQYFSVQTKPDVVMGVAPFNEWHFEVREGSERYNKIEKPYIDKMAANPPDAGNEKQMKENANEGARVNKLMNVYVEVMVNEKNLPVKPLKGGVTDLKIPGTFFTYKQPENKIIGFQRVGLSSYVLAFGNWRTAKFADADYQFHFTHPLATPYIENIVIIISGADDRVQEILHKTDWSKINEGLTL